MRKVLSFLILALALLFLLLAGGCTQNTPRAQNSVSTAAAPETGTPDTPESGADTPSPQQSAQSSPDPAISPSGATPPEPSQTPVMIEVPPYKGEIIKSPDKPSRDMPDIVFIEEERSITPVYCYEDDAYIYMKGLGYPYYAIEKKTGKSIHIASGVSIINYNHALYAYSSENGNDGGIYKTDLVTGKTEVLTTLGSSSFFIYDDKLYFYFKESGQEEYGLFSMNLDGSGKEKILDTAGEAEAYNGKIYRYIPPEFNLLHETDLKTGEERIFVNPISTYLYTALSHGKVIYYTKDEAADTVLFDIAAGRTEAILERGLSYTPLGQYIFYITGEKPKYNLKAYDLTTGKAYCASDLKPVNELIAMSKNSELWGLRASEKNLYMMLFTNMLHVYRIDIAGGKGKITEITK